LKGLCCVTETSSYLDSFTSDGLPSRDQWPTFIRDLPAVQYPDRINASVELLDSSIKLVGRDKTAVIADDGVWTYGELLDDVCRTAHVLIDAGLQSGNRVLLRSPNNGWLTIAWLAVLRAGGVVVTTIPMLRSGEIMQQTQVSEPNLAIVDHRYLEDWHSAGTEAILTIVVGDNSPQSLEMLSAAKPKYFEPYDSLASDICMLAFTSGTTGKPKATMHSHSDVIAIADTFSAEVVKPTPADIFCGTPPIAFTFGLGALLVFPLRVGATAVLLEAASPPNLLKAIEEHRITCIFTSPTAYRAMLKMIDTADLTSLRRCISAGEALPEFVWHEWHNATGVPLIDGIGATEMLHIFISASDSDIRPGFTGKAVPGYEAAVFDENLEILPPGVPGRLGVRGPTGCRYLMDGRQELYVQNGWNLTGDIYEVTADGYFRYLARADDMIVSSGYNIAAPEVENALLSHESVAEVAVIGVPDVDRGVVVKAFVVLHPSFIARDSDGEKELISILQDHVKMTIAPYKYPRLIEFTADLPKSATGKLQRQRLRNT
jgi:2-aminobenzoate-CoA ligase